MLFTTMHRELAMAAEGFGFGLFRDQGLRDLVEEALAESDRWQKRDCPLVAPLVVFFVLAMSLFRSVSIKCLMTQILGWMRAAVPELSLRAVTPEAMCHARERLGVETLKILFAKLGQRTSAPCSFLGLRAWAADGVHLTTPDTPANVAAFGKPGASRGASAFPQIQVVALLETTSRMIRDIVIDRTNGSEREGCLELLRHLGNGDLLMIDRGFAAAWLFDLIMAGMAHFLARMPKSWKPRILKRLGPGDYLVEITGDDAGTCQRRKLQRQNRKRNKGKAQKQQRRQKPETQPRKKIVLICRMLEYQIGDKEKVRLLTDLLDPAEYPSRELAVGYHRRWEVELGYDEIKTHLATVTQGKLNTVLRSKTPEGVLQEVYGLFATYNLVRALMLEAGKKHDIPAIEISFVEALHVIKNTLPDFERATPAEIPALLDRLLDDIAESRIDRPRRPRACPRTTRVKMSKWKLKRLCHRQSLLDFEAELRLCG